MKLGFTWYALAILLLALLLGVAHAQQSGPPNPEHPGQRQQSVSGSNGPGQAGSQATAGSQPSARQDQNVPPTDGNAAPAAAPTTSTSIDSEDNPYDPLLEPPPPAWIRCEIA
jgi:hypothetical protein